MSTAGSTSMQTDTRHPSSSRDRFTRETVVGVAEPPAAKVSAADLVTRHKSVIDSAIALVARHRRLSHDERQDLASMVYVKLLKDDAAVLCRYRGDSQLRTFLVTVIGRLLLDAQIARSGKWRPSARAQRLGRLAVRLERLIFCEGLHVQEAGEIVRQEFAVTHTDDELHFLATLLPPRWRRRFVGEHELERLHAETPSPEEQLLSRVPDARLSRLHRGLTALSDEDRRLIEMRFRDGLRACQIARAQNLDEKAIYRRFDKVLNQLRVAIENDTRGRSSAGRHDA
jgi:RNA polymerase sigma factor (sigma-70 family)